MEISLFFRNTCLKVFISEWKTSYMTSFTFFPVIAKGKGKVLEGCTGTQLRLIVKQVVTYYR